MEDKFRSLVEAGKCEQRWNCKNPIKYAVICDCGRVFAGCAEHSTYWGGGPPGAYRWSPLRALKQHLKLHRNHERLTQLYGVPR